MQAQWDSERLEQLKRLLSKAQILFKQRNPQCWPLIVQYIEDTDQDPETPPLIERLRTANQSWVREAARIYIENRYPNFDPASREYDGLCYFGTLAISLLWDKIEADPNLELAVRSEWLPFALSRLLFASDSKGLISVENLLQRFPSEGTTALLDKFRLQYTQHGDFFSLQYLDPISSQDLREQLAHILMTEPLRKPGIVTGLDWLASQDLDLAEKVAHHWLDQLPESNLSDEQLALIAASLAHLRGRLWESIYPRLIADIAFAKKVFLYAFHPFGFTLSKRLPLESYPDSFVADVAELMLRIFPPADDPKRSPGFHEVTALDDVVRFRDLFVSEVGSRGLTNAVERLAKLDVKEWDSWIPRLGLQAVAVNTSKEWRPIPPAELLSLAKQHDLIFARTNDDLLGALSISLERYEHHLHTTVHFRDVRDEHTQEPRLEETLSDYLSDWLAQNLPITASRETQTVHRKYTDIDVTVTIPHQKPLRVVIEVKKNESSGLLEKMKTQLVDGYLKAQGLTHGIYCVFWFEDRAVSNHPEIRTLEELQDFLNLQAKRLSQEGLTLKAKVIDCRLKSIIPADPHRSSKKNRARSHSSRSSRSKKPSKDSSTI
jgi:hypothetical protein